MIPSSPRLVAFAQSECDLTTPSVNTAVIKLEGHDPLTLGVGAPFTMGLRCNDPAPLFSL